MFFDVSKWVKMGQKWVKNESKWVKMGQSNLIILRFHPILVAQKTHKDEVSHKVHRKTRANSDDNPTSQSQPSRRCDCPLYHAPAQSESRLVHKTFETVSVPRLSFEMRPSSVVQRQPHFSFAI